ncbi:MAG: Holliday junction resolvase RuvX, partial [Pyrinomonadaceae bacterium]|nr:Holliday junction resolvase RuvX [Phycisphaerales bacterium]
ERLSSVAADWTMSQSGLTHKQKKLRRDALAAAGILQGFLDGLARREIEDAE